MTSCRDTCMLELSISFDAKLNLLEPTISQPSTADREEQPIRSAGVTMSDQRPIQKRKRPPFKPPRPRANTTGPDLGGSASPANQSSSKPSSSRKKSATTHSIDKTTPPSRRKQDQNTSSDGFGSSSKSSRKRSLSLTLSSNDDDDDSSPSHPRRRAPNDHNDDRSLSPDYILAEINTKPDAREELTTSDPQIPPKLLTRLLHRGFQQQDTKGNVNTKIAKDANMAVAKYMDVFVREALARAAAERKEATALEGLQSRIDNYLEVGCNMKNTFSSLVMTDKSCQVEDLEKLAPQMVLDF